MKEKLKQITNTVKNKSSETILQTADSLRKEAIKFFGSFEKKNVWSGIDHLPSGSAPETIVPGCLVLEGGSFRGLYTSGVLDVLMEHGINLQAVIGSSAGALNGYNYVAGQIGRSARINLTYRHDSRFFGPVSAVKSKGVVGFNFILDEIEGELPFDHERFNRPDRRFVATATECDTGCGIYLEKGIFPDMAQAVRASASMPMVSEPVDINGMSCLDGGCVWKIPYEWALNNGYEKILVVRTRPSWYRKPENKHGFTELADRIYVNRPRLRERLADQQQIYNSECEELEALEKEGRLMQLFPSGPIEVSVLEGDMEKLGALYLLGRRDTEFMLPRIREYLGLENDPA